MTIHDPDELRGRFKIKACRFAKILRKDKQLPPVASHLQNPMIIVKRLDDYYRIFENNL